MSRAFCFDLAGSMPLALSEECVVCVLRVCVNCESQFSCVRATEATTFIIEIQSLELPNLKA